MKIRGNTGFAVLFIVYLIQSASADAQPKPKEETRNLVKKEAEAPAGPAPALPAKGVLTPKEGLFQDKDGDSVKVAAEKSGNDGFVHGFIATFSVIVVSELGDKTFFIAAIMAMRHARSTIFLGAILALAVMHIMSSFFGWAITIIPRVYTYYISSFLFAVFGIKMLKEGWKMSPTEGQEELEEVQEDLLKREKEESGAGDAESGGVASLRRNILGFIPRIFLQAFTMTFLAEWGDRSQLATIVLAAREDVLAVVIAGILGHAVCTGIAVLGGRMIAQKISVRTVTLVGGVVFLFFALTAFFMDPNEV